MKVAICINTYARPRQLASLLGSLASLEVPAGVEPLVVVVDNDSRGTAREAVAQARLPWPIACEVESVRNISLARNRAVRRALSEGADMVAFIDDDETARPRWLAELLRVQRETGAEVVTGPVIARHLPEAPAWATRAGGFTRNPPLPSGTPVPTAATSNALVARTIVERIEFDPAFGLAGGGDSRFFLHARQAGARIVWAADAVVEETVPASRANLPWVVSRAFREGNCGAFVERGVLPLAAWVPSRLARALARLGLGTALLVVAPLHGTAGVVAALRQLAFAAGSITGTFGYRYFEYDRPHAD